MSFTQNRVNTKRAVNYLRVVFVSAIVGLSVSLYLLFSQLGQLPSFIDYPLIYVLSVVFSVIVGSIIAITSSYILVRLLPWKSSLLFRFFAEMALGLATILPLAYLAIWLIVNYIPVPLPVPGTEFDLFETQIRVIILAFIVSLSYSLANLLFYSYFIYTQEQVGQIRQNRQQVELQFDALRSQLSPHYLFNNLNTIYSLIHSSSQQADRYIRILTQTYQYILSTNKLKVVTLEQELQVTRVYAEMLNIRFGNAISIFIDLPARLAKLFIPPLSLQILIENAVKHNSFSDENPLVVRIETDGKWISVSNNINLSSTKSDSFRIGISNIRSRYASLTSKEIIIRSSDCFEVKLPLIESNDYSPTWEQEFKHQSFVIR